MSRVCIHTDRDGDPVAVDVILPSRVRIADLLPSIVGMVDVVPAFGDVARRWRLHRPSGGNLDESSSLSDNGVRDGDLLILDTDRAPTLGPVRRAACQEVGAFQPSERPRGRTVAAGLCVLTTVVAATVLAAGAGSGDATILAIIAAVGAAAAGVVAMTSEYPTAACVAAVALACAAGFLAVPSTPTAPNVFLAATAALSTCLLMVRVSGRPSPELVAVGALSLLTAVVTPIAMPMAVVGALLATASLVLLALAPRVSVLTARLGPDRWHGDVTAPAATGHAVLSGLVAGCAAGAGAGAVVMAIAERAGAAAIACTGLVGTVLLLRSRTYVDWSRRISIATGGFVAHAACLHLTLANHRGSTGPVACVLIVIGLLAVRRPRLGAGAARMLDRAEYVALAAVVPVACWAAGAYTTLGGIGAR